MKRPIHERRNICSARLEPRELLLMMCLAALMAITVACSAPQSSSPHKAAGAPYDQPQMGDLGKAPSATKAFTPVMQSKGQQLLSGSRVVIGTVPAINADQIKVDYPDSLQPRYLPLEQARAKGLELQEGDKVKMVFNAQHMLVDFHSLGPVEGQHEVIRGTIDQQMPVGQEHVVIRTTGGDTKTYAVRPLARSKMASMPVGVDAVFLADETGKIVDVTFGSEDAVDQATHEYQRMSNPIAPHKRINGVVFHPLEQGRITIETSAGTKWTYPVHAFLQGRLNAFKTGESLTLLIDTNNYVIDVSDVQYDR